MFDKSVARRVRVAAAATLCAIDFLPAGRAQRDSTPRSAYADGSSRVYLPKIDKIRASTHVHVHPLRWYRPGRQAVRSASTAAQRLR